MSTGAPAVGSHLLHYHVLSRLGAGGMGDVFLAEDTRLGRQVALKFLVSSDSADTEGRARLVRKALSKDPAFRYQSARELYVDLHHARERLLRESHSASPHLATRRFTWRELVPMSDPRLPAAAR